MIAAVDPRLKSSRVFGVAAMSRLLALAGGLFLGDTIGAGGGRWRVRRVVRRGRAGAAPGDLVRVPGPGDLLRIEQRGDRGRRVRGPDFAGGAARRRRGRVEQGIPAVLGAGRVAV